MTEPPKAEDPQKSRPRRLLDSLLPTPPQSSSTVPTLASQSTRTVDDIKSLSIMHNSELYPPAASTSSILTASSQPPKPPSGIQPSNYVSISLYGQSIKGTYVIDPSLHVPDETTGNTDNANRDNLLLSTDKKGLIDANVWVVGDNVKEEVGDNTWETGKTKLTKVVIKNRDGGIDLKLHADCATNPVSLKLTSSRDRGSRGYSVVVGIPRSFVGPFNISISGGSIVLSSALLRNVMIFSDSLDSSYRNSIRRRKGFIGAYTTSGYGSGEWLGSKLDIDCSNKHIKVFYVDELSGISSVFKQIRL